MKQASVLLFLFAFLLLTATAAQAQLMRKDTATLPRSKWEVGLDLKPIWDRSEPYNFVVRYFFKDRWALRGGMGLEMNWSKDTLDVVESQLTAPSPTYRYNLYEQFENKNSNFQVFLGIQFEQGEKKLKWYNAIDVFYFKYENHYLAPVATFGRREESIVVNDFIKTSSQDNIKNGGGINVVNGFSYRIVSNLSISTEMAVVGQRFKYMNQIDLRDYSVYGDETIKIIREEGWKHSIEVKPLFRVFINYHFIKN